MAKKVVASFRSTGLLQNLKNWLTQLNNNAISGDNNDKLQKLQKIGKTIAIYVSAGIDGKIRFVFTMSPGR